MPFSRPYPSTLARRKAEQVERLIAAAMDVLHHDRSEGSDVDKYECDTLRKKFAEILAR